MNSESPWSRSREVIVVVIGIVMAVGAVFVANRFSLWILVPVPAAVAIVYHLLSLSSRFESRKTVVEAYQKFTEEFDQNWTNTSAPTKVSEDLTENMERHKPTLASMLWGAALLTAVFTIPAVISDGGSKLTPQLGPTSEALSKAEAAAKAKTPSVAAIQKELDATRNRLRNANDGLPEWQRGLVFAGFGVWVLIVMRMIGRIHAGGLNARFLITAALRASAAMMLGFFAGATDILATFETAGTATYFLIGMFYPLFTEQLRDEAYKRFKRNKSITNELPTNWIDGVDDDTQDMLTEVNVLSVQHLATSDPGVLSVRSLFPLTRVIDLIDQAILISYFREKIVVLRTFGIRGVIDFVSAVEPVIHKTADRERAEKALTEMAARLEMSVDTLMTFGRSIYIDYRVNLLMRLWQHNVKGDGITATRETAAVTAPLAAERIPIMTAGTTSYSAFTVFVNDLIDAELRREAAERAARFREQNPDEPNPPKDWLDSTFAEAYAEAQQRATIGASPKAGARSREVYEKAVMGALGG